MLEVEQLCLKRRAFGPVSLLFRAGEVVLVCGRSGSGKSTLCQLVAQTQEPSSGKIEVGAGIGYVAHDFESQLIGSTVAEELELGDRLGNELEVGLREALVRLEAPLEGLGDRDPHDLPAALQQYLLVASLVRGGARLLLLDESVSHLDPRTRTDFAGALRFLADAGLTILLVSHQPELLPYVGRVLVMEQGTAIYDGGSDGFAASSYWERAGFRASGEDEAFPEGPLRVGVEPGGEARVVFPGGELSLEQGRSLVLAGWSGGGGSRALNSLYGLEATPGWRLEQAGVRRNCLLRQHVAPSFWRGTCAEEMEASRGAFGSLPSDLETVVMESIPAAWLDLPPWHLSHGQLRFLGAACLLLQYPGVLFLDQPFQGLDGPLRASLRAALVCYLRNGGRIVLTSHEPLEVCRFGHQAVWLRGGEPVWWGRGRDFSLEGEAAAGR